MLSAPNPESVRVICRFRPIREQLIRGAGQGALATTPIKTHKANCASCEIPKAKDATPGTSGAVSAGSPFSLDFGPDGKTMAFTPSAAVGGARSRPYQFTYDHILPSDSTQVDAFNAIAKATIADVLKGFNGSIFAYGQTGSGKTFTMFGPTGVPKLRGVIPRACDALFAGIADSEELEEVTIKCSFLEIYKEVIRDLLAPKNSNLKIRETPSGEVYVQGLSDEYVSSSEDIMALLAQGEKQRSVAATDMNEVSSRSHSLLIIIVNQKLKDGTVRVGKLNLADLAGSERVERTNASGETLEEAKKINQSLSALGNCINALTDVKRSHIPFRDSTLTFLLKDSLGGNTKTTLLVCASPEESDCLETLTTLNFAKRAKRIKNTVSVNLKLGVAELTLMVQELRKELALAQKTITALQKTIRTLQAGGSIPKEMMDELLKPFECSPGVEAIQQAASGDITQLGAASAAMIHNALEPQRRASQVSSPRDNHNHHDHNHAHDNGNHSPLLSSTPEPLEYLTADASEFLDSEPLPSSIAGGSSFSNDLNASPSSEFLYDDASTDEINKLLSNASSILQQSHRLQNSHDMSLDTIPEASSQRPSIADESAPTTTAADASRPATITESTAPSTTTDEKKDSDSTSDTTTTATVTESSSSATPSTTVTESSTTASSSASPASPTTTTTTEATPRRTSTVSDTRSSSASISTREARAASSVSPAASKSPISLADEVAAEVAAGLAADQGEKLANALDEIEQLKAQLEEQRLQAEEDRAHRAADMERMRESARTDARFEVKKELVQLQMAHSQQIQKLQAQIRGGPTSPSSVSSPSSGKDNAQVLALIEKNQRLEKEMQMMKETWTAYLDLILENQKMQEIEKRQAEEAAAQGQPVENSKKTAKIIKPVRQKQKSSGGFFGFFRKNSPERKEEPAPRAQSQSRPVSGHKTMPAPASRPAGPARANTLDVSTNSTSSTHARSASSNNVSSPSSHRGSFSSTATGSPATPTNDVPRSGASSAHIDTSRSTFDSSIRIGYLMKKPVGFSLTRQWKKRLFVLRPDSLDYYDWVEQDVTAGMTSPNATPRKDTAAASPDGRRPSIVPVPAPPNLKQNFRGSIPIDASTTVIATVYPDAIAGFTSGFEVITKDKHSKLTAMSDHDRAEWMKDLKQIVQTLKEGRDPIILVPGHVPAASSSSPPVQVDPNDTSYVHPDLLNANSMLAGALAALPVQQSPGPVVLAEGHVADEAELNRLARESKSGDPAVVPTTTSSSPPTSPDTSAPPSTSASFSSASPSAPTTAVDSSATAASTSTSAPSDVVAPADPLNPADDVAIPSRPRGHTAKPS